MSSNNDTAEQGNRQRERLRLRERTAVPPTSTPGARNFITEKIFHLSTEQRRDERFDSTLPTESAWGHTFLFKILYIPALTLSRIALFWNFAPSVFLGSEQF